MSVSSPVLNTRLDQFSYNGFGIAGGDSGSPVIDLNGQLVGMHQGEVEGTKDGWAQRMQEVVATLTGPTMGLKTDFGGTTPLMVPPAIVPGSVPGPVSPTAPVTGTLREGKDGLKYVWISPGAFTIGCSPGDDQCDGNEKPPHPVTITKGFWMGQTPVTQEAYRKVTGKSPSHFQGSNLPVEQVSWDEAVGYCKSVGLRLPTEAEWEYAARAGSASARYGNLDDIAWYRANSGARTHPVAQKLPNAWGLCDMLGNVWEWIADWYDKDYYSRKVAVDPTGPAAGTRRVVRGGSWSFSPVYVRASFRSGVGDAVRDLDVGFRCAGELR
jgi:formylglycine-generating enzyme required for sulfatase activity